MTKTNLPEKPKTGAALMQQYLNVNSVQETIQKSLGEQSGAFSASLLELYSSDKYLKECSPNAVIQEAMKAVALKLPIVKALGFAYIVAFKKVPTLQIGYKGYIQLALRTGQYRIVNADVVYEGEFIGNNKLTGEIDITGEKTSDKIVGYFAHMEYKNGFSKTLYWTVEGVKLHAKKYSKTYPNGAWKDDFDKMAVKTVLRNLLSHYGYLSVEMINAFSSDSDDVNPEERANQEKAQNANSEIFDPEYSVNEDQSGDQTTSIEDQQQQQEAPGY